MKEFDIKIGEGLCEYIRRVEKEKKEMFEISGIPKELMGNIRKFRPSGTNITGSAEFIKKFLPK